MTTIRRERSSDIAGVRLVNEAAFGRKGEADLVDLLRARGKLLVSLIAESEGRILGHIAFTRVRLEPERAGLALAGMELRAGALRTSGGTVRYEEQFDSC
jgi:putative acetyltransferase